MTQEFIKTERKNIERRSGLYKIVHRDTNDTYIGLSSSDMRSQISSLLAPSSIASKKDKYRLESAIDKYKEENFDFYVLYLDETRENLQKMLNELRDTEKPALCAYTYSKADEPFTPPPKPVLTINQAQIDTLKESINGVRDFFTNNMPDFSEVYQLLMFMIMNPDQDVETQIKNIAKNFLRETDGKTKTFCYGIVFLATNKMMQWNKDKTFYGMGNVQFLSYMVNLMNNRDLIEYADNAELKKCFAELCSFMLAKGKDFYKTSDYDFTFASNDNIVYEQYQWRIQERTDRSGKKGFIIFDKDGKGNLPVTDIDTINPVVR